MDLSEALSGIKEGQAEILAENLNEIREAAEIEDLKPQTNE